MCVCVSLNIIVFLCFSHSVDHGGEWRLKSGPQKYVCDLTLDPNTVHRKLCLSEENRKVSWRREEQSLPQSRSVSGLASRHSVLLQGLL
ncbi:hypothetical protein UPYG_G00095240 [Umbra pygmaea]|uniref:SPRY-associated domain-containing protein n=1 Tax=Umbra pygmaea TaxID=75934 RepID=A0ABD0XPI2_UMBPY